MKLVILSPAAAIALILSAAPLAAEPPVFSGLASIEVDGAWVPEPPREHPRLYLRARDLADLSRRAANPALAPVYSELQRIAGQNPQYRVEFAALQYLLNHDPEQARRAVADALTTLQKATYDTTISDISRAIGRMMVTGSVVYDWCYPVLTSEQKTAFIAEFVRLAKLLECGYPPVRGGYVTGHTSEWMIMRDLLSAGVAVYDEDPEMYRHAANRFFGGLLPVRDWWYPGHALHQGTFYCDMRWSADMFPLWIFDRMGAGNVFHPAQQFVPYQWIYMRRPDNQFLRSGDGYYKSPRLGNVLTASYYKDGYILADYLREPLTESSHKLYEFLWRDPDLAPRTVSELPNTRYMGFPYGWMVARTGWEEGSVIAEMKVNIHNFINHQHQDAGAFQIYYKGPLAVDSGLYQGSTGGYASPHHVNYHKRTIAHNSLLVYDPEEAFTAWRNPARNDGGQRLPNRWYEAGTLDILRTPEFKTGHVLGHGFGPDPEKPAYSYLAGDITEAYSAKVHQVQRSLVFLNLFDDAVPAAMIVFDRVTSANPAFRKYWLLHTMEEPSIAGSVSTAGLSERGWIGRLVNTTLLPASGNAAITKVGGPGKEFWVFGENFPNEVNRGDPNDHENGAWRLEISPVQEAATDLFLNVMQITDTGSGSLPPVERVEGKDVAGARVARSVVVFSTTGKRHYRPMGFSTGGEGEYQILAAGLGEGTWQVWRNESILYPALTATEEAGTLYFRGPAGDYSLRR